MVKIAPFIRRSLTLWFALIAWIGGSLSGNPYIRSGNMEIAKTLEYTYADGVSFCQGLAADGKIFYGIGCYKFLDYNAITKIDVETGEIIERREMCLPKDLLLKGYSHLGDGCLYEGKLYIALEDFGFRHPGLIVYDPDTLEAVDFHTLPDEGRGNGRIPWCVIKDDVLYYSQSNNVDEIRMLDLRDYSYLGALKIDTTLFKVQGGEIYNGTLYMVTNSGKRDKTMYAVNLQNGHVEPVFVRCTGKLDAEGEGLAICPLEDGSLFHIIDVGSKVRITSYRPTADF